MTQPTFSVSPAVAPFDIDDFAVWPDGTYATLEEVWRGEFEHKSDDYELVREDDRARLIELGVVMDSD